MNSHARQHRRRFIALWLPAIIAVSAGPLAAQCPPYACSFDGAGSLAACSVSIVGSVDFPAGINQQAAAFTGAGYLSMADATFSSAGGTIALWLRKTGTSAQGGVWQLGQLGTPNSLGLFYINQSTLVLESRNSAGALAQLSLDNALSSQWTHITASWERDAGGTSLVLFRDGQFAGFSQLAGASLPPPSTLQLGRTDYYNNGQFEADGLYAFNWRILDSEVFAAMTLSAGRQNPQQASKPISTGPVQVMGRELLVNGLPYEIRGVGYAPTPIGEWPGQTDIYGNAAILARDVPLIRAMNANTIRTWAQPGDATLLSSFYFGGSQPVRTIVGFWVPVSGLDYDDPAVIGEYENRFRDLVNQFKFHPGLLAWGLGNELDIHNDGEALAGWFRLANRLAHAAYEEEGSSYHPTILINARFEGVGDMLLDGDDASLNWIDMWGFNTYFGEDAHCYFDLYRQLTDKPMMFTEFGIDACDDRTGAEYQNTQAAWDVRQWRQIEANTCGATVMAYSDEWWKADEPTTQDYGGYATRNHPDGYSNEEWWGMVSVADGGGAVDVVTPRAVYDALAAEWAGEACDADNDGDVDLLDAVAFQRCLGQNSGTCAAAFDTQGDAVSHLDWPAFERCLAGPDQPSTCNQAP